YIWSRNLSNKDKLSIETMAGIIYPERVGDLVKVDMGEPIIEARLIPVDMDGVVINHPLIIDEHEFKITSLSMGNPHTVIVVEQLGSFPVHIYGPSIERHPLFPKRTNVEFINIRDSSTIDMRVWERGAGETMACGTGACAAAVASNLLGLVDRDTKVRLPGGELLINWSEDDNHVYMTGPAVEVFIGHIEL
ncbi:MAG: diaminopimelate epimerase, partial [Nitrospirae bacterium]